jgi:hypothetical protein
MFGESVDSNESVITAAKARTGSTIFISNEVGEVIKPLIETIGNGTCLFFYHPTEDYQKQSSFLNSDQYLPYEWVSTD